MSGMGKRWIPPDEYRKSVAAMVSLIEMAPPDLTAFEFYRGADETGVSGTGKVLEGVVYSDGTVCVHWTTEIWSVTFFPDWRSFVRVHVGSHPRNDARVVFYPRSRELPSWEWKQANAPVGMSVDECKSEAKCHHHPNESLDINDECHQCADEAKAR